MPKFFIEVELASDSYSAMDVKEEVGLAMTAISSEMFDSGIQILEVHEEN